MPVNYRILSFRDFSKQLIETGDLDPVYIAVHEVFQNKDPNQLKRWLLSYGMFYHVGISSYLSSFSQPEEFWETIEIAAKNEQPSPLGGRWPRSSERRHFRGQQALNLVADMKNRYEYNPHGFIDYIAAGAPDAKEIRKRVEEHVGFGGWASFKFCDLLDRVVGIPVEMDLTEAMYEEPTKGAYIVAKESQKFNLLREDVKEISIRFAVEEFNEATRGLMAPPRFERELGFLETETALCKFKGHFKGRYPIGKDIKECLHGSRDWAEESVLSGDLYTVFNRLYDNLPRKGTLFQC